MNLERGELGLLLAGDLRMRRLNARHRGVDETTDVLSFPLYGSVREFLSACEMFRGAEPLQAGGSLSEGGSPQAEPLLGDVVINPGRAALQALQNGLTLDEELTRLLVHGILHLIGFDHELNPYQARRMYKKQEELIRALSKMDGQLK